MRPGSHQKWDDGRTSELRLLPVGRLLAPRGLLAFKDPFAHSPAEVATVKVPPGKVAVELAVLRFSPSSDGMPEMDLATAVVLRLGAEAAVGWQRASRVGFAVDAGTGLLYDPRDDLGDPSSRAADIVSEVLRHQFMAEPADGDIRRLFFNCGMGDGVYDVWEGYSADGLTVCVVADLELLSHGIPLN